MFHCRRIRLEGCQWAIRGRRARSVREARSVTALALDVVIARVAGRAESGDGIRDRVAEIVGRMTRGAVADGTAAWKPEARDVGPPMTRATPRPSSGVRYPGGTAVPIPRTWKLITIDLGRVWPDGVTPAKPVPTIAARSTRPEPRSE